MRVFITEVARDSLKTICEYYKVNGYALYSDQLKKFVIAKSKTLSKYCLRGQEEELLKPLDQGHRYILVKKHYKLVYLIQAQEVIITDIFDTRQQPPKLIKKAKKFK